MDSSADPLADEDLQLALYAAYELHYAACRRRRALGVGALADRAPGPLEAAFEEAIRRSGLGRRTGGPERSDVELRAIAAADDGPPLSRYMDPARTREQMLEFLVHRSAYQLKEADPHSWAIPRLSAGQGGAGRGPGRRVRRRASRAHARSAVRHTMEAMGLDRSYGAYLDHLPAITLATVNLMSLFGLHRRNREHGRAISPCSR